LYCLLFFLMSESYSKKTLFHKKKALAHGERTNIDRATCSHLYSNI
jgi:hypothetical protein